MQRWTSPEQYLTELASRAVLPAGFSSATAALSFCPAERLVASPLPMNLSLILLDRPTAEFAAVFTSNRFPGAPVDIGRERLAADVVRGVLINNKVANVCAPGGRDNAEELLSFLGRLLGESSDRFFPASTGIIGWRLPVADMKAALPGLVAALAPSSLLPVARAIMTTDRFPKVRRAQVGSGSIVGTAKGAGMIEPNLATLLCFLCTDVSVGREELRAALASASERTLNRISIDSDQSTSDLALAFSSGERGRADPREFRTALSAVLGGLAEDVVRNGEGASHVLRVGISGARSEAEAVAAGKAVANSPLVKTAVCGNDPNVGRIAAAVGDWAGCTGVPLDPSLVAIRLGGVTIFSKGAFRLDARTEDELAAYLRSRAFDPVRRGHPEHEGCVEIGIELGLGSAEAEVLAADLTAEYVRENADYRS